MREFHVVLVLSLRHSLDGLTLAPEHLLHTSTPGGEYMATDSGVRNRFRETQEVCQCRPCTGGVAV